METGLISLQMEINLSDNIDMETLMGLVNINGRTGIPMLGNLKMVLSMEEENGESS